ncbi:MAG: hypothetical protein AB7P99_21170 [Vicinamibacterales bacterium]
MDAIALWLRGTDLSEAIRVLPWFWPFLEIVHFVGMCLLLGAIGLLDLRLVGFFRRIPVSALRRLLPWGIAGFALNFVSGVLFFLGAPDQYIHNLAFYGKLLFLVAAGVNALVFETTWGERVTAMGVIVETPRPLKVAGVVSIVSWLMVVYWGRMLPFIGNAF